MERQGKQLFGVKHYRKTANNFHVVQRAHFVNLSEKPIKGVFKDDMKEVYIIELIDRQDKNKIYTFPVGYYAAERLLHYVGQKPMRLFNPLQIQTANSSAGKSPVESFKSGGEEKCKTPLNKELYEAVNLMMAMYALQKVDRLFAKILRQVTEYPEFDAHDSYVKGFSAAIQKFNSPPKTLQEIISTMREKHPTLRQFHFPEMEKILGDKSFLGRPQKTISGNKIEPHPN